MTTPDYVGPTGPTVEQHTQPGYPQQQFANTDRQTNGEVHSEKFPEALNDIEEAGPVPAVERVHLAIANINPVPLVQEQRAATTKHFTADSHDLAHDLMIEGAVQLRDNRSSGDVRDIGWHKPSLEIPDPLIGGFSNGQLFAMIRRFNKVTSDFE